MGRLPLSPAPSAPPPEPRPQRPASYQDPPTPRPHLVPFQRKL